MCTSLSQAAGKLAPLGLGDLGPEQGNIEWKKETGIYVPSQCASQVTWQWDGDLRQRSFCSVKIFFAGIWIPWNPWDLISNPAYAVLYEFLASICHLFLMHILG